MEPMPIAAAIPSAEREPSATDLVAWEGAEIAIARRYADASRHDGACPTGRRTIQTGHRGLSGGLSLVEMRFGFAEKPDVPAALAAHADQTGCDPAAATFFLGRENPIPSLHPALPIWLRQQGSVRSGIGL